MIYTRIYFQLSIVSFHLSRPLPHTPTLTWSLARLLTYSHSLSPSHSGSFSLARSRLLTLSFTVTHSLALAFSLIDPSAPLVTSLHCRLLPHLLSRFLPSRLLTCSLSLIFSLTSSRARSLSLAFLLTLARFLLLSPAFSLCLSLTLGHLLSYSRS